MSLADILTLRGDDWCKFCTACANPSSLRQSVTSACLWRGQLMLQSSRQAAE